MKRFLSIFFISLLFLSFFPNDTNALDCNYTGSVTNVTENSIEIQLDAELGSFDLIGWDTFVDSTYGNHVPSPSGTYLFTGLSGNTTYNVNVRPLAYGDVTCGSYFWNQNVTTLPPSNTIPNTPVSTSNNGTSGSPVRVPNTTPNTLNWNYSDPDGDAQASYQVLVYNSSNALIRDSGQIASTNKFYTLTNTLTRGEVYYWKVRVWDSKGGVSSYSANGYFKVNQLPTLSNLNPLGPIGSPASVSNPPTLSWTYNDADGDMQTEYYIEIIDSSLTLIFDDGGTTNVNSYTVPAGILTSGQEYSWRVTVTDFYGGTATSAYQRFIPTGSLSITPPTFSNFPDVTLTGNSLSNTTHHTSNLVVEDLTNSGNGWNVTVQATQFTEVGGAGLRIPLNSLTLSNVATISPINGTVSPSPTTKAGSPWTIDGGSPVSILSAAVGNGKGTYSVAFSNPALRLNLNPATTYVDKVNFPSSPTPYQSTLTWSIISGP